jgi:hypothetical protein
MNKKAQYYPRQSYSYMSPILIIGIVIFVIPYLTLIFGVKFPGWLDTTFFWIGMLGIIGGAIHSMVMIGDN